MSEGDVHQLQLKHYHPSPTRQNKEQVESRKPLFVDVWPIIGCVQQHLWDGNICLNKRVTFLLHSSEYLAWRRDKHYVMEEDRFGRSGVITSGGITTPGQMPLQFSDGSLNGAKRRYETVSVFYRLYAAAWSEQPRCQPGLMQITVRYKCVRYWSQ